MKKLIFLIIIIIPFISALQITEIELNPLGPDTGNEWIELYSEEETNCSIKIQNNDGIEITINKSFKGYYVYTFPKQWLDNTDEKLFLLQDNRIIQETIILEDTKNDLQTFSLCDSWTLTDPTKNNQNNCNLPEPIEEEFQEPEIPKENIPEKQEETIPPQTNSQVNFPSKISEPITQDPLILNPKTFKTKNSFSIRDKGKYSIIVFCILLAILMLKKKNKTEFK
jgi:hypothetical protein